MTAVSAECSLRYLLYIKGNLINMIYRTDSGNMGAGKLPLLTLDIEIVKNALCCFTPFGNRCDN